MHEKNIYLTSDVNTGATHFACEYLRNFNLTELAEVQIKPMPHDSIMVSFFFETQPNFFMQIDIRNAFCVGYSGTGPWGLHDIMIDAGFPEDTANRVFVISRYEYTELKR